MTEQQALLIASALIVLPVMAIAAVAAIVGITASVRGRRSGRTWARRSDIKLVDKPPRSDTPRKTA